MTGLLDSPLVKIVRRPAGKVRRWLRARPSRTKEQRDRLLLSPALKPSHPALLEKIETRISPRDGMYRGDGSHYYKVGLSAIDCIEEALAATQIDQIQHALDLPCGHGRVLRFLVHRFPQTNFVACDLDRDGVDFCAEMFGAEPVYSQTNLREFTLDRKFDLIWSGSLITHLDHQKIFSLMDFFARHLLPDGLVVFTAAGDRVGEWMATGQFDYGIDKRQIPWLTNAYQENGYAYTDYPYLSDYGISLTSIEWIRNQIKQAGGLREVFFKPHGWDDHQDVYGFVREA